MPDDCKMARGLVLALYEKEQDAAAPRLSTVGEQYDECLNGKLQQLVQESALDGQLGTSQIFNGIDKQYESICIVGAGKEGLGYNQLETLHEGMENVRVAAAIGAQQLEAEKCSSISLEPMDYPEQVAEGATLALWQYQDNKAKGDRKIATKLSLHDSNDQDGWQRGIIKASAQNMARKLSEMPANQATPVGIAQETTDYLCPCGITVEVRNNDWIESKNMQCLLAVGRSSCESPVFLEISYCGGDKSEKPVLLVGNGLTFNTGGICLKPTVQIDEFRASMAGAAVAIATMRAVAELSLPINVSAVIPLCEHLTSGMSLKPGDIFNTLNDKTICLHDTDNIGVLMIADAMCFGIERYKPKLVIDVATLSEGMTKALGSGATGLFTNSHDMWQQIASAGAYSGDRVWRLPLWKHFDRQVKNYRHVDLSNKGFGKGEPCLLAACIREFCSDIDWIHMDVYGVGMNTTTNVIPYLPFHRMTGRSTRTLIQLLYQLACPEAKKYWDVRE